jgi:heme/copper-type cytochrome/quinol oxidase subunit 4
MSGELTRNEAGGGMEGAGGHGQGVGHDDTHQGHGSVALYVWVGVILAIVTGVEVAIFYIEALADVKVPLMVILSLAKVVLVVMFFMHLKMDHRGLTWIFMAGAALALFMVSALTILYHLLPGLGG